MINKLKTFTLTLILGVLLSTSTSQALILISEINSNGTGGDFFEIYNSGTTEVDLTGWRWTDRDLKAWSTGFTLNSSTLLAGETAVIPVASSLGGTPSAIATFKAAWGLSDSVKLIGYTGAGAGLGSGDGVLLFNSSGNLAASLIYRLQGSPADLATQQDGSTVQLATFIKATSPQPTANGHAGLMGGGTATDSLVWDPTSGTANPTYRNAVVGQWGAFANPNSSVTIGSPGVAVPEPSSTALLGLGSLALLGLRRLNRKS